MLDLASPRDRDRMVEVQIARRGVRDRHVLDAMRSVPREAFVEPGFEEFAYEDGPLPIGQGQTISQPYIVALMIEAAEVKPGDSVLEVGAGSGYAAAVIVGSLTAFTPLSATRNSASPPSTGSRSLVTKISNCVSATERVDGRRLRPLTRFWSRRAGRTCQWR